MVSSIEEIRANDVYEPIHQLVLTLQHPMTREQGEAYTNYLDALVREQEVNCAVGGAVVMGRSVEENSRHILERFQRLNSSSFYQRAFRGLEDARNRFFQTLRDDPDGRYDGHPLIGKST